MTRGEKKFIIGLGLVLVFWQVAELSAVQHAFLQFIAVGEVPGLKQPLSPEGVYMVLATIFSLSLILIFRKELMRWLRRYRPQQDRATDVIEAKAGMPVMPSVASTSASAVPAPQVMRPALVIRRQRFAGTTIPMPKLRLDDKKLPVLYVPKIPSIMPSIWRLMDLEMRLLTVLYRRVNLACRFIWKHAYRVTAAFGHWLAPHIRYLDKKIEKRLRRNSAASEVLEIVEECWRMLRARIRKAKPSNEPS